MISQAEIYLQELWDIKYELYSDFKSSNFSNYIEFIKNEIKELEFQYSDSEKQETKKELTII